MGKIAFTVMGARVLVKEIVSTLSIEERAKRAGLTAVVLDENRPKVTTGRVVALGTDPLVHEMFQLGDVVHFGVYAGLNVTIEGEEGYRSLTIHEITGREREVSDPSPTA